MTSYPIAAITAGAAIAYLTATLAATLLARLGFPLPPAERRIGCIDGLRGYLALSVLVHHFVIWLQVTRLGGGWTPPTVSLFNQLGAGGVALFFMTTGLVFYPRVLAGFRSCAWFAIYTNRLFRIVPLIVVSVVVITAIIVLRTGRSLDRGFPSATVMWITAWGEPPLLGYPDSGRLNAYVLWSLWYEWLFYLFVLPACALAMDLVRGRLPSWIVPAALLLGAMAARAFSAPGGMPTYLPLFAIGMLAYEGQRRESLARLLRTAGAAGLATAALALGMLATSDPYGLALPVFGFFFTCVACGNSMGGLLRTKGALVLGECSYGIYLLHGILLSLLFVDLAGSTGSLTAAQATILLPVVATGAALVTPLTYLLVERPAIRAGRKLATRWIGRQPRAPRLEIAP